MYGRDLKEKVPDLFYKKKNELLKELPGNSVKNDFVWSCSYQWVKFDVCKPGDGHLPPGLPEDSAALSFEAFQRQIFDEDHDDPVLSGIFLTFPFWFENWPAPPLHT